MGWVGIIPIWILLLNCFRWKSTACTREQPTCRRIVKSRSTSRVPSPPQDGHLSPAASPKDFWEFLPHLGPGLCEPASCQVLRLKLCPSATRWFSGRRPPAWHGQGSGTHLQGRSRSSWRHLDWRLSKMMHPRLSSGRSMASSST